MYTKNQVFDFHPDNILNIFSKYNNLAHFVIFLARHTNRPMYFFKGYMYATSSIFNRWHLGTPNLKGKSSLIFSSATYSPDLYSPVPGLTMTVWPSRMKYGVNQKPNWTNSESTSLERTSPGPMRGQCVDYNEFF